MNGLDRAPAPAPRRDTSSLARLLNTQANALMIDSRPRPLRTKWCARNVVGAARILATDLLHTDSLRTARHAFEIILNLSACLSELAAAFNSINHHLDTGRDRGEITGQELAFRESRAALDQASDGLTEIQQALEKACLAIAVYCDDVLGDAHEAWL